MVVAIANRKSNGCDGGSGCADGATDPQKSARSETRTMTTRCLHAHIALEVLAPLVLAPAGLARAVLALLVHA